MFGPVTSSAIPVTDIPSPNNLFHTLPSQSNTNALIPTNYTMRCNVCLENYESRLHAITPCDGHLICSFCIQSLNAQGQMKSCPACNQLWGDEFKRAYYEPQKSFFIWSRECESIQRNQDSEYWQEGLLALNSTLKFYLDAPDQISAQHNIFLQLQQFFSWLIQQLPEGLTGSIVQKKNFLKSIFKNSEFFLNSEFGFEKVSIGLNFLLKLGEIHFHPIFFDYKSGWNINTKHTSAVRLIYQVFQHLNNLRSVFKNPDEIVLLENIYQNIKAYIHKNYIEFIKVYSLKNNTSQNLIGDCNQLAAFIFSNENLSDELLGKYICLPFEWVRSHTYTDYLTFTQSDSAILGIESIWFPQKLAIMFDVNQKSYWFKKISNIINSVDETLDKNFNAMNEYTNLRTDQSGMIAWMKSLILCKNIKNTIFLIQVLKLLESLKQLSDLEKSCMEILENNHDHLLGWPMILKDFLLKIKAIYHLAYQLNVQWEQFSNAKGIEKIRIKNDLSILTSCILKSKSFFDEYFKNFSSGIFRLLIKSLQTSIDFSKEQSETALNFFLNEIISMKAFARFDKNDTLTISKNFIFQNLNALFIISEKILTFQESSSVNPQKIQQLSDELCLVKNSIIISSDLAEQILPIFDSLEQKLST